MKIVRIFLIVSVFFLLFTGCTESNDSNTNSDSDISVVIDDTVENENSYSSVDWRSECPEPWVFDILESDIIGGTRTLDRCVYENLSAPLRTIEYRPDRTRMSDLYHVVFFTDSENLASLTSRTVKRLGFDINDDLASETLTNIYLNDVNGNWESANTKYSLWNGNGILYEEIEYYNLQHNSGIWDDPVKIHTRWYDDGALSYKHQYDSAENPDHWASVAVSSVSYEADGRNKIRYEDYEIHQNSDGYWNSFPTHVMSWSGNPSYQNGDFIYTVIQQPSGEWVSFETRQYDIDSSGTVTDSRHHEIYLDETCNCYKSLRIYP